MKRILITGGNGYIAQNIFAKFKNTCEIKLLTRKDFDLLDSKSTNNFFKKNCFDVVINAAIKGASRLVEENYEIIYQNLLMFDNLLSNRSQYIKLINFGSGAEIYKSTSSYGLSKKIINNILKNEDNCYNLRIFGIFNENELNSRFIKSCILSCIQKQKVNIHCNVLFDFFYMEDFLSLLDYYINNDNVKSIIDCVYPTKVSLLEIAKFICKQFDLNPSDTINIINSSSGIDYIGKSELPDLSFVGLEEGIVETKNKIVQNLIY